MVVAMVVLVVMVWEERWCHVRSDGSGWRRCRRRRCWRRRRRSSNATFSDPGGGSARDLGYGTACSRPWHVMVEAVGARGGALAWHASSPVSGGASAWSRVLLLAAGHLEAPGSAPAPGPCSS